ncbi:hypothetical protein HYV82_00415 [Candidatus Woesearchaeota archaeon]|nr:hypothetical protein [Candidatus Woesearchaeota archaeon]
MQYVLTRKEAPQGDEKSIAATLGVESPHVQRIFQRHNVRVSSLMPSKDAARFAGLEERLISPYVVERMRRDLDPFGYDLRGPFDTWNRAYEFWETGQ